ncbi:F420-non-reducing hydrogenase Vhu subunit A [Methanococcus voltae]|jgi:F420-non-reducing hydrogenase large subunit|uniref:F420-non-reducing hydrogenase vhu subunit A n=3 Tax=Methanococcus voltae TaxID=2188 RepID=VHUA_METVO|nr:F420-non-reducing hydrogenase Vhu subunit A [Methanococcus voltae]Q00407.2 RecName: Full=F420-non-reducing hydrogenase vhu subunit A [Methanococcus voltae]MBP2172340.1 F420-non-reducing hydrogenase large subunit [Methanococcus voltae]MBP2200704.1 F420-non-reducing hydrogenase large subunit [Methanococcus voltae]MCS3921428.1 F420-non-reducing hydrogenase large subunit [Methanococcus voltae PS]CAA43510.1 methylviologen-reducing hydrogenase subunit [Methanococcus voltae PS]
MGKITIAPLTRLEGHGKVTIKLDDSGKPADVKLHITALRGFEQFVIGRPAEEVPRIVPRICGICQTAHHLASVKAVDAAWGAQIPSAAEKQRELMHLGNMIHSHALHFYYLAAPDFVLGPDADPAIRNIVGVIDAAPEVAKKAIAMRRVGQSMVEATGGKPIHPVTGIPGGLSKSMSEEKRDELLAEIDTMIQYGQDGLDLMKSLNEKYLDTINSLGVIDTWYLGLVKDGKHNFYGDTLRFVSPDGSEKMEFKPAEYLDYLGEHVVEHSYVKYPYNKKVGYPEGLYRVGPLAMINVCDSMSTPLAEEARKEFAETFGRPANQSIAYNQARLIELLSACERAKELLEDPEIVSTDVKAEVEPKAGNGVGVVYAPRGTLFHNYETDDNGIVTKANMIVATTHNVPTMEKAIQQAAEVLFKDN